MLSLCWLGAGLACSADDDVQDDPLGPGDGMAGSANATANAGSGGSSSAAAGRGGSAGTRSGAGSGEAGSGNGEGPPEPGSIDDGAAAGESGIFVGMTAAHNAARAAVDADPPLPPLTWSDDLALVAQDWADHLTSTECGSIEHRQPNMYGENIAMRGTTRLVDPYPPEEAVDGWNAEVACWDFGTISRTEQCDVECARSLFSNGCGHYTQLAWRNTQRVGCGYSTCQGGMFTYEVWVCNYDPQGNIIGQAPY